MRIAMNLTIDGHSPIPIRRQLTEQLKHAIESGGGARGHAPPPNRGLGGLLRLNSNTGARGAAGLKQSGYREARRGGGGVVGPAPPALLAGAHREPLRRWAQSPWGTRGGGASAAAETPHTRDHSTATPRLPTIALVGACPAEGAALGRLLRRVDVIVCSTAAAERVRGLAGSSVQVMIDDRALDQRAIEMLAALLVRENGDRPAGPAPRARRGLSPRPSNGRERRRGAARATTQRK